MRVPGRTPGVVLALLVTCLPAGAQGPLPCPGAPVPLADKKEPVDPSGDPLPHGALARLGTLRFRSPHSVDAVAFSPDGNTLISGSRDGAVWRWQLGTGKLLGGFRAVAASPLALSPDGKTLALVRPGPSVWLWNLITGRELLCLRRDSGDVNDLTFSSDGTMVAAGGYAEMNGVSGFGTVHVWNAATGKRLHVFKDASGPIRTVRFAPDGRSLAAGGGGKDLKNPIRLWGSGDRETAAQLPGTPIAHSGPRLHA